MCLAIPAQVIEVLSDDRARIELGGVVKEVSLALVDDVNVGDFVIVHVGFALSKLSQEEAEETLQLFADAGVIRITTASEAAE
ncbi:MAG: HypC/HybG/HupF family hydrogenase formation chaperone [Rhodospirillales bacterium]|nr:HypC/HybG/HupF family hydrogenase formation chaperone [Rhodospirillales bacterium]